MPRWTRRKSHASRTAQEEAIISVKPVRATFGDLPNELLYLVRDFIPKRSLRDHIAFQSSCRQVRVLYEKDDRFWKSACHAYGISRPAPSEEFPYTTSKVTWRQLAIMVVNHQECCDIPACKPSDIPGASTSARLLPARYSERTRVS